MNFRDAKNAINELSNLSDEELTAELNRQIKIKKANGSLGDLEKMVRMISPFLTPEQKTRLAGIIKSMQDNPNQQEG